MDRKINIFIGGSSEGLKFAQKVKKSLESLGDIQCTIWNKDVFQYNETFLNSLSKASLIHDFGIFIASKDDLAIIRENIQNIPRDNVLFEYGLFLGALRNNKTFLFQEEGCKLPTDLLGYTTPKFSKNFSQKQWTDLAKSVIDKIKHEFQRSEIQLLPSTSLAIGYFNSFLSRVSKCIFDNEGCLLNKSNTHHKNVIIKILIPNELSDDISAKAQIFYKRENLVADEIGDLKRPFPIRYFKRESSDEILIFDIPTTLNAIRPAINLLMPDGGIGVNREKILVERKELENFKRTLAYLVEQDDYSKNMVEVEWMVE